MLVTADSRTDLGLPPVTGHIGTATASRPCGSPHSCSWSVADILPGRS